MRLTLRHVAAVALVLSACQADDDSASTAPHTDSRLILALSAHTDTIPEATTKLLSARVTDQNGLPKSASITWTSTDPNIASVSNGLVTGVARGVASVIASTTGAADTATIVVTENDLLLDLQPNAATVAVGDTLDFKATLRTRSGAIVPVNSVKWSLSDSSAAEFVSEGLLHLKKEGDLSIIAEALQRQANSNVKVFRTPVASVTITPGTANVYRGGSINLVAALRDQNGRVVQDRIRWGSSDFSKATVTQDGYVTGVGVGSVVITATADSKTGSATINVLSPAATTVSLDISDDTVLVGQTVQASVTALDAAGDSLTGKTIGWQSHNPSIATVNSTGEVKGIAEGDVTVSAIVDGVVASTALAVKGRKATSMTISPAAPSVSVGQQAQLVARVLDQDGFEITGQTISWLSTNAVATISPSGVLTGVSAGSSIIKATSGTLSASVTATVVANSAVFSVRISPPSASVQVGNTVTLVAEALDANQMVLAGRPATWSSQNPAIASVSSSGVVTGKTAGSTNVTATIEGKSANVFVTVNALPLAPVASIMVSAPSTILDPGQQTQATAVLKDAQGNTLTGRVITWSSLDTSVVKISASGLVTAVSGGTVAIMARSEGISASLSLTVKTTLAAPVVKATIDVPKQNLNVGETVQTTVTLYDANNNILTGRTITYVTDNPAVLTVSATGLVKGMGSGSTRIKASSGGVTVGETMYVAGGTVATISSISVSAPTSALTVGGTVQASAIAKDAQGSTISGTSFAWTTSNSSVATVSSSGLISAVGVGSATITAASSGITGSMSVSVTAASTALASSVSVSLAPTSVTVGATSQASFIAKDIAGATLSGKTATWTLSNTSLAQVSAAGVVTALAAGTVSVRATVDGVTGSSDLTITAVSSTPLPPPPSSSVVELPRTYLNYSFPAKTGQTILVPAGGNLQTALNNAQRGDEIVLTAGATYSGNFTLPAKSGTAANGWIIIRSDKLGQLPPMGTRVTSAQASLMPKIETPNVSPALKTVGASHGWWIAGVEITVTGSLTAQQYGLVNFGDGAATSLSQVPHDLVLDRTYVHGQTTTNMSRCITLNSGRAQVSDSYVAECHGQGFDSQAIWGGNGPGPFKIVNNTLMGAGENIMFGGSDPKIPGLVPSDIEIRRNYVYTPIAWKGKWTRKNLLEFKNASRVLLEGNVFDGSWGDAQTGWAIIMKSANQYGGCRWCRTTDVTFRRNVVRNAGAGINIAGTGDNSAVDTAARRIFVSEVVLENIGVLPYNGDQRGFQLLSGSSYVTLERTVLAGNLTANMMLDNSGGSQYAVFRDNVWARGQYGVMASGTTAGTASLNVGAPGWTWTNMFLIGAQQPGYPTGTTWISSESAAPLAAQIRSIVGQATSGVIIP